jgi:hypothetical protein
LALWLLGYPKTALEETERAITAARETDHIPTLLFALSCTALTHICCRDAAVAATNLDECIALAQGKVPFFKMFAGAQRGCVLAQTGKAADAIQAINAEIAGLRAMGATTWRTAYLSHLALAYAALGKLDDAGRCIGEAMTAVETTKEAGTKLRSIASLEKSPSIRPIRTRLELKPISSALSPSPANNKPSPGNSVPR